jgi:hypothetical protein
MKARRSPPTRPPGRLPLALAVAAVEAAPGSLPIKALAVLEDAVQLGSLPRLAAVAGPGAARLKTIVRTCAPLAAAVHLTDGLSRLAVPPQLAPGASR